MLQGAVLVAAASLLSGCTIVSSQDNAAAATGIAARQLSSSSVSWRRDAGAEERAASAVRELLRNGVTAEESVAICFLAHPEVQLAFETLEVSRSEVVAASTLANPVAIVGTRQAGGNLSAFYPQRTVNVGVLQNMLALVNLPTRRRIATRELERARIEAADRLVALAADVNEAYISYVAARRIHALRIEEASTARGTLELLRQNVEADAAAEGELLLLQERTAMLQVESSGLRSELDLRTARARLAQAMGIAGREEGWEAEELLPPPPATDPDPRLLEVSALENRLDLQAARKAVEARLDGAGVQLRWRWLGAVEAGAFREGVSGGTSFVGPNAMIELPLFDQRQAQILAANAESRAAARRLESQLLVARGEIRTHGAELAATRQLLMRYESDLLPAFRRMRDVAGPASIDGRRATLAALNAEEERVGLLRDYWRARGALARAAGAWEAMPDWPKVEQAGASRSGAATP